MATVHGVQTIWEFAMPNPSRMPPVVRLPMPLKPTAPPITCSTTGYGRTSA